MTGHELLFYGIFFVVLGISMRRDYQQHKKDEIITIKAALKETLFRIVIACLF
ncbi:MAG: hypothetical protein LBI53_04390 [Candidatus Peribacteria bacterium]|nr:hypothetical protein [Candidatus Peribacteria bacterium]